jgi:hypothetical protein
MSKKRQNIDEYILLLKNINIKRLFVESFNVNKIVSIIEKLDNLEKNISNSKILINLDIKKKYPSNTQFIGNTIISLKKELKKMLETSRKIIENRQQKEINNSEKLIKINKLLVFLDKIEDEFTKCTNIPIKKISENHHNYNAILNKIIDLPSNNLIKNLQDYAIVLKNEKSNKIKYIEDIVLYVKDYIEKLKSDFKKMIEPSNEKFIQLYEKLIITNMNIDEKIRYLKDLIEEYKDLYNIQILNISNKSKKFKEYYEDSKNYLQDLKFLRTFYTISKNSRLVYYTNRRDSYTTLIDNIKKSKRPTVPQNFNILEIIKQKLLKNRHSNSYITNLGI